MSKHSLPNEGVRQDGPCTFQPRLPQFEAANAVNHGAHPSEFASDLSEFAFDLSESQQQAFENVHIVLLWVFL
jgi:hypothetical protein